MAEGAFQDVGNDLHVAMSVSAEAAARLHAVFVDDPQRAEAYEAIVVVVGEGEGVAGVEPAVVELPAVGCLANGDHWVASVSVNKLAFPGCIMMLPQETDESSAVYDAVRVFSHIAGCDRRRARFPSRRLHLQRPATASLGPR